MTDAGAFLAEIRELKEKTEGVADFARRVDRETAHKLLGGAEVVAVVMGADGAGEFADALDLVKDLVAGLFAHDFAQARRQEPNLLLQLRIHTMSLAYSRRMNRATATMAPEVFVPSIAKYS